MKFIYFSKLFKVRISMGKKCNIVYWYVTSHQGKIQFSWNKIK